MVMRRLALWMVVAVAAGACATDGADTTVTPPSIDTTAPTTTAGSTAPPSTAVRPDPPEVSLIVSRLGGIDLLTDRDEIRLPGDADYRVIAAFDDLAGGLVYQYEVTPEQFPPGSILRIPAGGFEPQVVLSAAAGGTIRLLDVEKVEGRTTVLYLAGVEGSDPDSLVIADLAGGAPELVARADPAAAPGSAGVSPTAILDGALSDRGVAVVWWYGDIEAACSYVEVFDFAGATLFGPMPAVCGEGDLSHVALSADGSRIAYAGRGTAAVAVIDSGEQLGEWSAGEVIGLDFDGSTVVLTSVDTYDILSLRGLPPTEYPLPPTATLLVSARGPIDIAAGTFLGGIRTLSIACSAAGMPAAPEPQGGLPAAVAATRDAIVGAASECDVDALSALTGGTFTYSFGSGGAPGRFWRQNEQEGYGALARIVDVLSLPYVVLESDGGRLYAWPSAFQEEPSDEDWAALADVYNEEDVDLFKDYGGYIGMRVGIAEDGTWMFAVEGD